MRFPRTLSLQVTGEIATYTALGFLAILTVLVSQNLVRRLDSLMMVGLSASDFLRVLRCLLPMLASYAAPLAFLLGALLTMRRMSMDREILAIRSCGLGLRCLLVPTLGLGLLASLLSAYLMISLEHRARRQMLSIFKSAAVKGGILEPGRFRMIGHRMFIVEGRDRENRLEGIMIVDQTDPNRPMRIFAERGQLSFDEETDLLLFRLERGDVHLRPDPKQPERYRRLAFDRLDYAFDVGTLLGGGFAPLRPKEMTLAEIREIQARVAGGDTLHGLHQRNPMDYELEVQRRFALPAAPLLFAMLAVPMGLRVSGSGRAWGVIQCFLVAFSYYAALAAGQFAARDGWLAPVVALWLPNVVFGALGIGLLVRDSRGRPR